MKIAITGTGSYIPSKVISNKNFEGNHFLNADGSSIKHENSVIIEKFRAITGIEERRYVDKNLKTSDIAFLAAEKAIDNAGINKEELDYIIFAHNFGDVAYGQSQSDLLPSLATRVKHHLRIKNPRCVAYDIIFGCPGWVEGVIQANAFIKSGLAKKCLVIGADTLSRITDPNDRDSMIYADGAGATIVEATEDSGQILAHSSATYTFDEAYFLFYGETYKQTKEDTKYIKMHGRKIYEFALTKVPEAMKQCLEESTFDIGDLKKIFIHQANEKMDEAIVKRFYKLYQREVPEGIMPMIISKFGNSSVATIPTLFDMVRNGKLADHQIQSGDVIIFASVGAGMNVNAVVYQV